MDSLRELVKRGGLRHIGVTGSSTSTTSAPLILLEGMEDEVREEDIVLIENRNGDLILAVCRQGTGVNENLRVGSYSPGIAYVRAKGEVPSKVKESYHFTLMFIGVIDEDGVRSNDAIVSPGVPVYTFKGSDYNPLTLIEPRDEYGCVHGGFLAKERKWSVPFHKRFIPYHIGVFGTTGSGKSFLTRLLLIPVLKEAGYGILVLDWSGMDYAPYMKDVVSVTDVKQQPDSIIEYIVEKTKNFGYGQEVNTARTALEEVVSRRWRSLIEGCMDAVSLREKLIEEIERVIISERIREDAKRLAIARIERGFAKISAEEISLFMGKKEIKDIIPDKGEVKVVDMSGVDTEIKLSFFLTLADHLLLKMHRGETLNLALVVDEAPQYCPFEPRGIQREATLRIRNLCALGRKHNFCMVLISQGIAGEIGINAAVRRNLNTWFIGQIHSLDLEEVEKRLSPYGIRPERLLYLPVGQFYFVGKMNPSPTPLLISFDIEGG